MSAAETTTSVKGALDGLNAAQNAVQAGGQASGQAASSLAPGASDAAASAAQHAPGASDAMAGAVSALGQADSLFSWGGYFQALAVLFLIVAVLFTALWFLRRKGGIKLLTGHGNLLVESRMSLGPKKQLVVVRFLNKRVLLGVTDQRITMLTELPTDEDHTEQDDTVPANAADFKAHLTRAAQTEQEGPG